MRSDKQSLCEVIDLYCLLNSCFIILYSNVWTKHKRVLCTLSCSRTLMHTESECFAQAICCWLRTKAWWVTVWASANGGGGRHLGPALLPARWQGSPPAECACVSALLKGQKLCERYTSQTAFCKCTSCCSALCAFAVLRYVSESQVWVRMVARHPQHEDK